MQINNTCTCSKVVSSEIGVGGGGGGGRGAGRLSGVADPHRKGRVWSNAYTEPVSVECN